MSLRDYAKKRQFDRTPEPRPENSARKAGRELFVVQLHHARRRHYDFRLQVGDVLKSWACPKGPSYDPKVKRLAVEVEDHPVSYAAFQGDIPDGYGAGHVDTFDTGVWATQGDAEAQLLKGHLRFELFGKRLKGGWHLVRSGRKERQPAWFLIKAKDAFAGDVEADDLLDAKMTRTSWRPLVSGTLTSRQALVFALALAALSMLVLVLWVNVLTAALTFLSLIGYAVVYTVFLKRATPQNIVIGGIAGAAPPALGWAAVTGELHAHALLLVLIIFVWTPPHFWALAIFRRDDYARAMVPMLPVTHGVEYTRWQILLYTVLLVIVTVLPWATGMSGLFYLGGALVLGLVFLWYAWELLDPPDEFYPMRVFNYSIVYLMALFAFLLVDHWLLPYLQPASALEFVPGG